MSDILVLFDSGYGMTEALAREVCHGVDSVPGMASRMRIVRAWYSAARPISAT